MLVVIRCLSQIVRLPVPPLNAITGEAMAMGERAPVAPINPAASARLAVAEAVTNIALSPH